MIKMYAPFLYAYFVFILLIKGFVSQQGATFFVRGFGYALFNLIFKGKEKMKILIWFVAILLNSVITTALNMTIGAIGAIPTVILWAITIYPAYKLCQRWDVHKLVHKAEAKGCKPIEILLKSNSNKEKAALEKCRGNADKLTTLLERMNVKKQYKPFYWEHFMAPKEFVDEGDSTTL